MLQESSSSTKTEWNGRNKVLIINSLAVPAVTCSFNEPNWNMSDIRNIDLTTCII